MKRFIRRNKPNLFLLFLIILFAFLAIKFQWFVFDVVDKEGHIEILTINSIFIGFLYTTLGVMVGFLGSTKIANMDRAGYLDEYYYTIYFGLFFFIVSALIGLLAAFFKPFSEIDAIYTIELLFLIAGLTFFVKALINLVKVIKKVRKSL